MSVIHPHGERFSVTVRCRLLFSKNFISGIFSRKQTGRGFIFPAQLFCPSPAIMAEQNQSPDLGDWCAPLHRIICSGYDSGHIGTLRYNRKTPHYGGASLATGSISLLLDLGRCISPGLRTSPLVMGYHDSLRPFPSAAGSTAGGAASMLAHRSTGASVFLLSSACFTLSHSANAARCEWYFCLYCVRFVRRHEMNQHSASLLSLVKDF